MGSKPPEFAPADNPASDSDSLLTRTLTYNYLPFLNSWLLLYPSVLSFDWSMEAVPLIESFTDLRNLCTLTFYGVLFYTSKQILDSLCAPDVARTHNGNGFTHISSSSSSSSSNSHGHTYHHKAHHSSVHHRRTERRGSSSSTDSGGTTSCDDASQSSVLLSQQSVLDILIISLAILVIPFIPATNLFFYVGFVIAERVLYIPSLGFCLLIAQGVQLVTRKYCRTRRQHYQLWFVVATLVLAYSARTVRRNQDWLSEENLYKSGISVNPAKAWGNLANVLNSQGKIHEAEEAYRAALRQRGNMADVHYNLGILLQEQKRYQEAIDSYQMAITCRPRLTMAHLNLGIVYGLLGNKDEAAKTYRHCKDIDISGLKDPRVHEHTKISALYNLGRLLADEDKYEEAIDVYKEAMRRRPSHYAPQSLYNMLGESYAKLDKLDEAEHWYREALKVKPDHIPAHLTMAKLCHRKHQTREAEEWFIKANKLDPKDGSVYQHYGQFLGDTGRHEEAADKYIAATKWSQEDFELLFNTANALRQATRNAEAEAYYRRAAKLGPKVAAAHMNLGAMLHYNGKLEEAEQSYLTALKYKPDDAVTQANLQKLRNLLKKAKSDARR